MLLLLTVIDVFSIVVVHYFSGLCCVVCRRCHPFDFGGTVFLVLSFSSFLGLCYRSLLLFVLLLLSPFFWAVAAFVVISNNRI